ncbi:MAG: HD-GYP domain-containing protein [Betaproteobacteria bacterium]|nr:HD-GYP domain-containing protein [Betaproteobacteria bacterium]
MIKKISVEDLVPGMYVHDLNCGWMEHPFLTNTFLVDGRARIAKIRSLGIKELYIDTERGLDLSHARTVEEVEGTLQQQMETIAEEREDIARFVEPIRGSIKAEAPRARKLHTETNQVIQNLMQSVRMGAQIEIDRMMPLTESMIDSILANQSAMLPLTALKRHDTYTFEHSVSSCALMIAFARKLGMSREIIRDLALGALMHDIGKARIPNSILNKPGSLTSSEFTHMKLHATHGVEILEKAPNVSAISVQVTAQHHERYDGSGYPKRLKGDEISIYGKMSSIVDVYDAISSNRVYHRGLRPSEAMKKMLEWSEFHFDPKLVHSFIRAIGIYPAGSLVRLESGRLAVVRDQNEGDLLHPVVTVIYHTHKMQYLPPEQIDLASGVDRVISYEDFSKWKIDPLPWLPA